MTGWVLILAFLTYAGNSGMSVTSAVYADRAACEAAGRAAEAALSNGNRLIGGSTVRFSCSPQSSAPQVSVPAR